jgi:hypothetical protein
MSLLAPTRILIVGGGGRQHALAWKLAAEPGVNEIVVAPGSDAIGLEPRVRCVPGVDPVDGAAIVAVARRVAAELVVIGPEAPLAAGVADALLEAGFAVFGPTAAAARIESSKAFCHEVAAAAGVRMAPAVVCTSRAEADRAASGIADHPPGECAHDRARALPDRAHPALRLAVRGHDDASDPPAAGRDEAGGAVTRKRLRRGQMLTFFAGLPPCLVGMEACATAHYWAREIRNLGHDVKIIPASYVKPYVARQKNDAADAAAICEAATRPAVRSVTHR